MSIISTIRQKVASANVKVVGILALFILAGGLGAALVNSASAAVPVVNTPNCDDNAVMYCGATSVGSFQSKYANGDGNPYKESLASMHNIYDWFGISSSDVSNMNKDGETVVEGYVTDANNVYTGTPTNNVLVATNALTAGRTNPYGSASTKRTENGTTFYTRPPKVSFENPALGAMVVMKNGVFQFAILHSCGNAVIGTPKTPNYTISKQVRTVGGAYVSNVTVKAGTTVQYEIVVSSTGDIAVDGVTVRDSLPAGVTFTSGTLEANGKAVSASDASKFFGSGLSVGDMAKGTKVTYTFSAVAGANPSADTCKQETVNNEGYITAPGLPSKQSGATVTETCTPPPPPPAGSLACDNLTLTPGTVESNGDQSYGLEATASASNATISNYAFIFGDNTSKTVTTGATSASTTHTYAPGNYTTSVTVNGTANGKSLSATSNDCKVSVTVKKPTPPPTGSLVCDNLTLTAGTADTDGNVPYTLSATASANNATISNYVFDFGDGSNQQTVATGNTGTTTTHTYAPGSYTATVTVNGTANGKAVTSSPASCSGQVTVGKPPVVPPTPEYACVSLTATPTDQPDANGNVMYTLNATASATNATITNYDFNFGDNTQDAMVATGDTTASATHTYAPGSYTAQVTVMVQLADGTAKQVTADACQTKITIAAPTCTSPSGQTYPVGSSECQPAPTCTAPSGQTYPAGSNQCTPTTPTTPATSLPNTGPGDVFGLFSGITMSGAGMHRIFSNRRARRAL